MANKLLLFCFLALGIVLGLYIQAVFFTPELDVEVNSRIDHFLKENPEIVYDMLSKDSERLFDLVLEGQENKRHSAMVESWQRQIENPMKVKFDTTRPMRGKENAPITILEFSDFQCPHCARASHTIRQLLKKYPDQIKVYFLNFPLKSHKEARIAAQFFEAAGLQDHAKAWVLHDLLFDNQEAVKKGGEDWIKQQADKLGLDVERLVADAHGDLVNDRIENDLELTDIHELAGAPSFVINGVLIAGAAPPQEFEELIKMILENQNNPAKAPAEPAENNATKSAE